MFLTKINFDTVFDPIKTDAYKRVSSREYFREIKFEKIKLKEGVIVGSSFKFDGCYKQGRYNYDPEENEPSEFNPTKRIDFWIVYVSMNEMYLVPKKEPEKHRFELNENEYVEPELTLQECLDF